MIWLDIPQELRSMKFIHIHGHFESSISMIKLPLSIFQQVKESIIIFVSRTTARASSVFASWMEPADGPTSSLEGGPQGIGDENILADGLLHQRLVGKALDKALDEII
ncbi:hypothetical protein E4U16_005670 [Claviceps sp. LM84 group G4]|nr:hypothetical protein E4U16_005670 [Claviceps sp. LM84 group G4]